ncbi:hypothetical protein FIY30_23040 [Salmonella enterica]|uniref:Uncharacterized protein n=1 Tax=Salmonella enterica TaxID=28901 RepID=A0A5Y2ZXQ0_SALER|nr:hypothetical protein [Salmonella enterica]EAS0935804.1 hypothetical protein [Salmonella enterica]EAT9250852.1 hypothetical protein [Salmonella enterica]EAV7952739.1 hypothetical protein [Salmonella enterica]EAV9264998.1 hypothetical protein [Salmonella enterica]
MLYRYYSDPHFQRLTGLPPEGATLRFMWHWHVITRRRPSQITGTLACCISATLQREHLRS